MQRNELKAWENKKYYIDYQTTIEIMINRLKGIRIDKNLVIPEYQRDYVWKESEIPKLLTSLYQGFPIGIIVMWDLADKNELYLIDGLQRHWALYKIYEKPLNYLSYSLFQKWIKKNNNYEIDSENDANRFKHLKSKLHHKKNNYKKAEKDKVIEWISNSDSKECNWNGGSKNKFIHFINEYYSWFENNYLNINIPHYIIDEMNVQEVSDVFSIMNSTGTSLSTFEVVSAKWSQYKINLSEEINYISEFNKNRIRKYKRNFEKNVILGDSLLGFSDREIIPSNFIYSIFIEAVKENKLLFNTYCKKEDEMIIMLPKAIEPAAEIIMLYLAKTFDIDNLEFEDLGETLSKNIKNKSQIDKMIKKIKAVLKKTSNNIDAINLSNKNHGEFSKGFPVWLVTAFASHIMNGSNKNQIKYFSKWFINEMFITKRMNAGSGNKARDAINKNEFNTECENNVDLITIADSSDFKKLSYNSRDMAIILSALQEGNVATSNEYDVDHLIPRAFLADYDDVEFNTLYNLQFLPHHINNEKSDQFNEDQIEWDVFKDLYTKSQLNKIKDELKKINLNKDDKEIVKNSFDIIMKIRKEIFIQKMDKINWAKRT